MLAILKNMKLNMKMYAIKDAENVKQASGVNIPKPPPDDPRCKVCFKQVTSKE